MLLISLMRSTPGFWMPELSVPPPDGLYGKIAIPRLTARNDSYCRHNPFGSGFGWSTTGLAPRFATSAT